MIIVTRVLHILSKAIVLSLLLCFSRYSTFIFSRSFDQKNSFPRREDESGSRYLQSFPAHL